MKNRFSCETNATIELPRWIAIIERAELLSGVVFYTPAVAHAHPVGAGGGRGRKAKASLYDSALVRLKAHEERAMARTSSRESAAMPRLELAACKALA